MREVASGLQKHYKVDDLKARVVLVAANLTGGTLRGYQIEGVRWLNQLNANGCNGILADEMGLGKTIQIVGLVAHLTTLETYGAYLVVAPLSTLQNWVNEFDKWCPDLGLDGLPVGGFGAGYKDGPARRPAKGKKAKKGAKGAKRGKGKGKGGAGGAGGDGLVHNRECHCKCEKCRKGRPPTGEGCAACANYCPTCRDGLFCAAAPRQKRVFLYHGDQATRAKMWQRMCALGRAEMEGGFRSGSIVVVTSYEIAMRDRKSLMFSPHGGGVHVCRSSSSGCSRSSATLQFSQALGGVVAGPMCHSNHWPSIFEKVTKAECAHGGIMTPGTGA